MVVNGFVLETRSSYSLNYLVFIYNVFLNNQENNRQQNYKFPYIAGVSWGLLAGSDFLTQFEKVWNYCVEQIYNTPANDLSLVKSEIFRALFEENDTGLQGFQQADKAFRAWWVHLIGQFSLEHAIDTDREQLYSELSKKIHHTPNRRLVLQLVYDDFPDNCVDSFPFLKIVPLSTLIFKKYYTQLIPSLVQICK